MNRTPKPRIGWKSSVTAAYIQAAKPIRNRMPAAARTSRSLKTAKSYSAVFSPKSKVLVLIAKSLFSEIVLREKSLMIRQLVFHLRLFLLSQARRA